MVIDLDRCTGCGACVTACKAENNVAIVSEDDAKMGRTMFWMKMLVGYEGEYPNIKMKFIPRLCFECDKPPCIKVCPVRATYKNEDGLVAQIYPQCIGCRYCMAACPYTVKVFNWYRYVPEKPMSNCINPDVSVRPKGVVEKCTFCIHRLQKAKELAQAEHRKMREGDYVPACMQVCPAKAFYFGDLDNPQNRVTEAMRDVRGFTLLEDLGTDPKVHYLHAK